MKNLSKTIKRNRRGIFSLFLALALIFSFEYTPISLISERLSGIFSSVSNAYTSSQTQQYYTSSSTSTESNISSGNYPSSLDEYFSDSDSNFNIYSYYTERYADLYAKYIDEYLKVCLDDTYAEYYSGSYFVDSVSKNYAQNYKDYLSLIGYDTLYEYYEANESSIQTAYGVSNFMEYVEYFVSHTIEYTYTDSTSNEEVTFYVYPLSWLTYDEDETEPTYRSKFYCAVANYFISGSNVSVKYDDDSNYDGIPEEYYFTDEFYDHSVSYLRFKSYIDGVIEETIALYAYDGATQNKYLASIIADGVPISSLYYYDDSTFVTEGTPLKEFETTTSGTVTYPTVYYFGSSDDIKTSDMYINYSSYLSSDNNISILEADPMSYYLIQEGDFGYIDSSHLTYYKFDSSSTAYNQTNDQYDVYVLVSDSADVSESELATYAALYNYTILTESELAADTDGFYVQVPYSTSLTCYFDTLASYIKSVSTVYYSNFVDLFTDDNGNSLLYLKLNSNSDKKVFIDVGGMTQTAADNLINQIYADPDFNYTYKIYAINISDPTITDSTSGYIVYENPNDYSEITTTYSSYLITDSDYSEYTLYFQNVKVYYESYTTTYSSSYETKAEPDVSFVQHEVAASSYELDGESKKIYILDDDETSGSTKTLEVNGVTYEFETITSNDLESSVANLYVKVSTVLSNQLNNVQESGLVSETTSYTFYYKHNLTTVNQIYVLDDADDAEDNEVYKNLNYTVLTTEEYETGFSYYELTEDDADYNSNFTLYYKYNTDEENTFVQNLVTDNRAIYVIDDSLTTTDIETYIKLGYIVLTTEEYEAEEEFYIQISSASYENEEGTTTYYDANYNESYTALYYKYVSKTGGNVVYLYSSSDSDDYETFYSTDSDYDPDAYVLIGKDDPNYVEGLDLYYKKIGTETVTTSETDSSLAEITYYYYQTSSTVTLAAGGYYLLTFYVYTNGTYAENTDYYTQASVYVKDSNGIIEDIEFEHISTNGVWQMYSVYIATDPDSDSAIEIYFYMGDEDSIVGSYYDDIIAGGITNVSGIVLFDEITVYTINQTDFYKQTLDEEKLYNEDLTAIDNSQVTHYYASNYATSEVDADDSSITHYYDASEVELDLASGYETYEVFIKSVNYNVISNDALVWNGTNYVSWSSMFDFDDDASLQDYLNNTDDNGLTFTTYNSYTDYKNYSELWQYYIGVDLLTQGNDYTVSQYENAYSNGYVNVSVISESEIDKEPEEEVEEVEEGEEGTEEEEEEETEEETTETTLVSSTFKYNNNVLKIENTHKQVSLGISSNAIQIEQNTYYKLTIWIYSPDEDATATITLNPTLNVSSSDGSSATTASVNANIAGYSDEPTNEYGWIPITFYIEGNSVSNGEVYLVLAANANCTVYFDNITIEKISSSDYDTASSDSDTTTYTLSLAGTTFSSESGVTNGYFDNITVSDNYKTTNYSVSSYDGVTEVESYKTVDSSTPYVAESWTVSSSSSGVVAGVVPTNTVYTSLSKNFYTEYNNQNVVSTSTGINTNVYAIYAPTEATGVAGDTASVTNVYSMYASSLALSSSSVYKISFSFYAASGFSGNMVSTLYYSSVSDSNILSQIIDAYEVTTDSGWVTYTYYVATAASSVTAYLEIGISNATGVCFFDAVTCTTVSDTLDNLRDTLILGDTDSNQASATANVYESLNTTRFIDLTDSNLSIHSETTNDDDVYDSLSYTSSVVNTATYTAGKSGVVVASWYERSYSYSYTVTINDTTYYIRETYDEDGDAILDSENNPVYALYSDSIYTKEVTEIGEYTVTSVSTSKVVLTLEVEDGDDETSEYDTTETETTNYYYDFGDGEITINNNTIPASELNNNYSENVIILANGYSTDYILISPTYSTTLSTSSYYVLKIYVKTSAFDSEDFGLNISVSSLSVTFENIDTTTSDKADENGFVCYQVLISTNESSVSSFAVEFSLGSSESTGTGYAIIAGTELVTYTDETLFTEYTSQYDDDDTTAKKYYGTISDDSTSSDSDSDSDTDIGDWAATFFYVFSSLLLVVAIIVAIVGAWFKKHPIKIVEEQENEHERDNDLNKSKSKTKKKSKNAEDGVIDITPEENESSEESSDEENFNEDTTDSNTPGKSSKKKKSDNDEEGFV